jgi:predicted dehydrogenase
MEKVKVAVVGCGMIAERSYLPGIAQMSRADLVAVCDIVEDRARLLQSKFNVPHYYTDLVTMLDEEDFDLLVNLTIIPAHYPLNLTALQAGKHLYSEKTFAQTVEQATELIDTARAQGVKLGAAAATMLSPINQKAKSLIEEGAIGKVTFAKVLSSHGGPAYFPAWPTDPTWFYKEGSGPILDMGVYGLHTITGLLGPAEQVMALSGISDAVRTVRGGPFEGKHINVEEDDLTLIMLDFGQVTFGIVDASYCVRASKAPSLEVYGTDGTISADPMDWIGIGQPLSLWRDEVALGIRGWTDVALQDIAWDLPMGVAHLIDCILEGKQPITSGEHARHVLEIMNTCITAARTGKAQKLTTSF